MTDDATFYRENGYVLVPGVFDAAEVEEMREAIGRILENVEGTAHDRDHAWRGGHIDEDELSTLQVKGYHDLPYHDAVFTRMVAQPRIVEVLTSLIGPDVQLHHTKMLVKPPEQGAPFPMHQDYPYFPHERHSVLAASIHLDDTDEENGCLHVRPRLAQARPPRGARRVEDGRLPARERNAVPRWSRRRPLLQLPHSPRLGHQPQHAYAAEHPLPVQGPGGSTPPRRGGRRPRRLGHGADGRRRQSGLLGLEAALPRPAGADRTA